MPEIKEMTAKKIATRESYGNALVELGQINDKIIVLDADLAAATKTGVFKKAFPERHVDCGIAECNMMGIAAGLAAAARYRLQVPLPCLRQAGHLNRSGIPSVIRT